MRRGSRAFAIAAILATGVGLSLLIWAKLKIVASVPRSAYAEPKAVHPDPQSPKAEPDTLPGSNHPHTPTASGQDSPPLDTPRH